METRAALEKTSLDARLRREEEQLQLTEFDRERFFDLALDMLCTASFDGHFVRLNPAFENTLGYTREELRAASFCTFVHPDDLAVTYAAHARLVQQGERVEVENRYRAKDGSWRWLAWKAVADRDAKLIYATARDVTEYRRVEQSLRAREQNAQLQLAVGACLLKTQSLSESLDQACQALAEQIDISRICVWTLEPVTNLFVLRGAAGAAPTGQALSSQLELAPSVLGRIAQSRLPLLLEDLSADPAAAELFEMAPAGSRAVAAYPLIARGIVKGVLIVFGERPLPGEEHRTLEIVAQELSAAISRYRTQEALRKSEAEARRLALVAAQSSKAVIIADPAGDIEWVNEAFLRMLAYSPEEARSRPVSEILTSDHTEPAAADLMRMAIREGQPFFIETMTGRRDGMPLYVTIEGQPLFDDQRSLVNFMAVVTDTTERKIAEEKLQASEEYNRSIVESTADTLEVIRLKDGTMQPLGSWSQWHDSHSPGHSINWLDRWVEDDRVTALEAMIGAGAGQITRFQGSTVAADQSVTVWDVVLSPIRGKDGQPERLLAVSRDITQQRQNEAALRELNATLEERVEKRAADLAESQARFSTAMHNSAVGMALVGLDGHWLEVNQSLCRTLGYSVTDLLATDFQSVTHPDDLQRDLSQVRHLLAGDIDSYEMEKRYLHRDGSTIWGHLSVSLTRDSSGRPLYFISQIQDITKRKRAELELIQSEERFRQMIDCVQDYAIFMLDTDGQVASWNRGAERTTGYTAAEILGKTFAIFHPAANGDAPRVPALLAEAARQGYVKDEGWHVRKDGRKIWAEVVLTAVKDSAGQLRGFANVTHDLTKRREAEAQSLRSQRLEAIGNIASGVAHDLNNALGPILLGLDLLRATYPKENTLVETFESCGRRAADMVRQLVSFARGAEGERVLVQLSYLLKEMQKIIPGILPKNIQSSWQWPEDLRSVHGDPTQIHQILLNLCVNARDAMPHGGQLKVVAANVDVDEVFASSQEGARPGHYVRIDVSDSGQGIPPEIIERIFEPFFTTKSPDKGSGLGLATVMGIVKGHGGFLNVYSKLGAGATFSVFLPVCVDGEGADQPVVSTVKYRGQGEKILVVDDELTIREVSRRVLQRLNFQPITATDGADALIHIVKFSAELKAVITDMHMPHMDGLGLVRALRRMVPEMPVIVASGRLEEAEKHELENLEVVGLLHKPFTEDELAAVLEGVIGKKPQPISRDMLAAF